MELYIFNMELDLLGIVDEIEEMDWNRRYYDTGDCLIKALLTTNNLNLLKKGHIIAKKNDLSDPMIIEHREISDEDADGMELLTVEAISLSKRILSSRITLGRQIEKGTADKIMENILLAQTNNSENERRHIKRLEVDTSIKEDFINEYEHNSLYKSLDEEFETIAMLDGAGYTVYLDLENKKYVFKAYKGKDVSDKVLFSTLFDNLSNQNFIESDNNYKNVAIVAGQGENEDRDIIVYNDEAYSDIDRIELMVDARDIEQEVKIEKDKNGEEIEVPVRNGATAVKLLEERAKEKLEETSKVRSYTASISGNNYVYREDYNLGDIVSIKNDKWDISYKDRIIEINEQYDSAGITINIEFGKEMPTLAQKINQKLRRI